MSEPRRWDIFGKVIDNFGDAGFCWRLARKLVNEHAIAVTLWVDDISALARIAHELDPGRSEQAVLGVTLRRWSEPVVVDAMPDVVIEAFGCGLPDHYVMAMAQTPEAPAWFILEYLSAEAWIEGAHRGISPHPRLPLMRRFWFPGFTPKTGGLLREHGILEARDAYCGDDTAQRAFWSWLHIPEPQSDELRVSLFCYPNAPLPDLLDAWCDGDTPVSCIVPQGVAAGALDLWTHGEVPHVGHPYERGRLTLYTIPFLDQQDYDHLLWFCAVNFVRGEDSFVRAQWAQQPFVWHVYPQTEGTHWRKQEAFLERFLPNLAPSAASAVRGFWEAWNGVPGADDIGAEWARFVQNQHEIGVHVAAWAHRLTLLPELAQGLVDAASETV